MNRVKSSYCGSDRKSPSTTWTDWALSAVIKMCCPLRTQDFRTAVRCYIPAERLSAMKIDSAQKLTQIVRTIMPSQHFCVRRRDECRTAPPKTTRSKSLSVSGKRLSGRYAATRQTPVIVILCPGSGKNSRSGRTIDTRSPRSSPTEARDNP